MCENWRNLLLLALSCFPGSFSQACVGIGPTTTCQVLGFVNNELKTFFGVAEANSFLSSAALAVFAVNGSRNANLVCQDQPQFVALPQGQQFRLPPFDHVRTVNSDC